MLLLSDRDRSLGLELRRRNVLEAVEPHRLDQRRGIITILCADGDQAPELTTQHGCFCLEAGNPNRQHTFGLNGGALLLHPKSPIAELSEGETLIAHAKGAMEMKGITAVALYAHAPCGMAYHHNLSLAQVIDLLMYGHTYLQDRIPHATSYPFIHIDYGEGRKRTYFVSSQRWRQWCVDTVFLSLITGQAPGYLHLG